jgi:UDP-glucose 4-epimerase
MAYLMKTWLAGQTARVQTPRYVRDNIHVSLLAKAYAAFVDASPPPGTVRRLSPSGYLESQGAFADRVRREAAARLGLPCRLDFGVTNRIPGAARTHQYGCSRWGSIGMGRGAGWEEFAAYHGPSLCFTA